MLLLSHTRSINLIVAGCFLRPISTLVSPARLSHPVVSEPWRSSTSSNRSMSSHSSLPLLSNDVRWNATISATGYLISQDAYDLDQDLFSMGFTLEQLMELAGLSVAEAVNKCIPLHQPIHETKSSVPDDRRKMKRILVVCGPGNNGGDGLVAARHLVLFGYDVAIVYPKLSTRESHYNKLIQQCRLFGIPILDNMPLRPGLSDAAADEQNLDAFDGIIDAIFGFSFKGEAREPFKSCILDMIYAQQELKSKIISVDVPSGWNVDEGDITGSGLYPDVLVSLTAPKLCTRFYQGKHYVGGRFVPPSIAKKYNIKMPPYQGYDQVYDYDDSIL